MYEVNMCFEVIPDDETSRGYTAKITSPVVIRTTWCGFSDTLYYRMFTSLLLLSYPARVSETTMPEPTTAVPGRADYQGDRIKAAPEEFPEGHETQSEAVTRRERSA